jgi:hypothetical protein
MRGRAKKWFPPAREREERKRIERQATALIRAADRKKTRHPEPPSSSSPSPALTSSGWVPLADLKRALRRKERAAQS